MNHFNYEKKCRCDVAVNARRLQAPLFQTILVESHFKEIENTTSTGQHFKAHQRPGYIEMWGYKDRIIDS